ncbi:MAG: hypothetical protein ACR2NL_02690, partial [Acidimicrobiia bacterium]
VEARIGPLGQQTWELTKTESSWLIVADPCRLLEPHLTDRMTMAATDLLEVGLYAVRSAFVTQEDFGFSAGAVAVFDPNLIFVPRDEVGFGTVYYSGSPAEGLLLTGGPTGVFYCAVESLAAATVYGTAETADELRTPSRCRRHSN